jgi:hypothetical protein
VQTCARSSSWHGCSNYIRQGIWALALMKARDARTVNHAPASGLSAKALWARAAEKQVASMNHIDWIRHGTCFDRFFKKVAGLLKSPRAWDGRINVCYQAPLDSTPGGAGLGCVSAPWRSYRRSLDPARVSEEVRGGRALDGGACSPSDGVERATAGWRH